MALSIPLVWADAHRLHDSQTGVWVGFRAAERSLGALGLPIDFAQEGGYALETIGSHVRAVEGFEEGVA